MGKIVFLVIYFGELPWYFNYFYKSCVDNQTVDFIFIGDNFELLPNSDNIKKIQFTIENFNYLASSKLKMSINIKSGYKVCDFRPAFGDIFSDYIINYDFWCICDVDVILGNIRGFLTKEILDEYDYISVRPEYPTGFMSIFRNCEKVNNLYKKSKFLKKVFLNNESFMFDECAGCYSEVCAGQNILDVNCDIDSLHHLLELEKDSITSLYEYFSIQNIPGNIRYYKGVLSYKGKYEILVYHLSDYKVNIHSKKVKINYMPEKFFINSYSFCKINFLMKNINMIKDYYRYYKFSFGKKFDILLLKILRNNQVTLNDNIFSYMHKKILIQYPNKFVSLDTSLSGKIYKSFIFKDYFYFEGLNKFSYFTNNGICFIEKNGNVIFFKKETK